MRKVIVGIAAVIVAAFALTGCGSEPAPRFAKKVALVNLYEIQAAKIASEKSQSAAVKSFAQKITADQTKLGDELKSLVKSQKIDVVLPTKLDAKHKNLLNKLSSVSAADFDKTYAAQEITVQEKAITVFQKYIHDGGNDALKAFASKSLPMVQAHLSLAKGLTH